MAHKCFISFKKENEPYKIFIQNNLDVDMIDKSLNTPIDSNDDDYILSTIRRNYLSDSTVTIHLIGLYGADNRGWQEQRFIKRELQASLYNSESSSRSGILGIVLPEIEDVIYKGSIVCSTCQSNHNLIALNDNTTIKEFSYNYYIPNGKCYHSEDERYCVLVKWEDFCQSPEIYIEKAYEKRAHPIAAKIRVKGGA